MDVMLLRRALARAGRNDEEAAAALGMCPQTFARRLRSRAGFYPAEALRLCEWLGIDDPDTCAQIFLSGLQ